MEGGVTTPQACSFLFYEIEATTEALQAPFQTLSELAMFCELCRTSLSQHRILWWFSKNAESKHNPEVEYDFSVSLRSFSVSLTSNIHYES